MAAGSTSSISSRAQFLYVSTSAGSVRSTQSALASRPLELELTEGMRFDKGYISPCLVTDAERMEAVLDEPHVLVVENRISNLDDLLPILEKIMQSGKQLLIIAEEVEGEAAAMMVVRRRLMTRDSRRERAVDSSPLVGGCGTRRDGRPRCPTPTGRGRRRGAHQGGRGELRGPGRDRHQGRTGEPAHRAVAGGDRSGHRRGSDLGHHRGPGERHGWHLRPLRPAAAGHYRGCGPCGRGGSRAV